jgi:hypothetical protein
MNHGAADEGFALLAVLIVVALAGVFAVVCVAAVSARQQVMVSDAWASRARAQARCGLDQACLRLRQTAGDVRFVASPSGDDGGWQAHMSPLSTQPCALWPAVQVEITAAAAGARSTLSSVVELRAAPVAQGVSVAGDVELHDSVQVTDGGLYSGGCVRGRELLSFRSSTDESSQQGADLVHGDLWPIAAAHALGGIWAEGREVHAGGLATSSYPLDTDTHVGESVAGVVPDVPDVCELAALREQAVDPGAAFSDGRLDLSRLPFDPPATATGVSPERGYVVVLSQGDGVPVRVVGIRPPGACPVSLVVAGDMVVGEGSGVTRFNGALVSCGALDIQGPARVDGHLFARSLCVTAPLTVAVSPDWRKRLLAGLVEPVIVSLEGV